MGRNVGHKPKNKLPINRLPTGLKSAPEATTMPYKPSQKDLDRERRYKAEDALRDIERAEDYRNDKQLMSDVKQLASEKIANLKKV